MWNAGGLNWKGVGETGGVGHVMCQVARPNLNWPTV